MTDLNSGLNFKNEREARCYGTRMVNKDVEVVMWDQLFTSREEVPLSTLILALKGKYNSLEKLKVFHKPSRGVPHNKRRLCMDQVSVHCPGEGHCTKKDFSTTGK